MLHESEETFFSNLVLLEDVEDFEGELLELLLILIDKAFDLLEVFLGSDWHDEAAENRSQLFGN